MTRACSLPYRRFLSRLLDVGVQPDWLASLNLKSPGGPDGPVNLGYIAKNGAIATDMTSYKLGAGQLLSGNAGETWRRHASQAGRCDMAVPRRGARQGGMKVEQLLPERAGLG